MRICKFFNSEKGCRSTEEKCGHSHVLYCTNEICVKAEKQHTHTHATCGQKGGGAHEAFIAKKKEAAMAEKAKKREAEAPAKNAIGEVLYTQVLSNLTDNDNAGYKQVLTDFPVEFPVDKLAGKIVGMFLEGLNIEELNELTTMATELNERMVEAVNLLHEVSKKQAE